MTALIERMKGDFKPYVPTICPAIVDRLGKDFSNASKFCIVLNIFNKFCFIF